MAKSATARANARSTSSFTMSRFNCVRVTSGVRGEMVIGVVIGGLWETAAAVDDGICCGMVPRGAADVGGGLGREINPRRGVGMRVYVNSETFPGEGAGVEMTGSMDGAGVARDWRSETCAPSVIPES